MNMKTHNLFVDFLSMCCKHIVLGFIITFLSTYIMYFDLRKQLMMSGPNPNHLICWKHQLQGLMAQAFGFKGKFNIYLWQNERKIYELDIFLTIKHSWQGSYMYQCPEIPPPERQEVFHDLQVNFSPTKVQPQK